MLEDVGSIVGILCPECCGRPLRIAAAPDQRQCGDQEELRASIAGIALKGLVEQPDRHFGTAEQQLGKSAEKEPDAVPPVRGIETHRAFDRRPGFIGAAEKGRIVPRKAVRDAQRLIHRQGLFEGALGLLQLSCRGVQHALHAMCVGMPRGNR